MTHESKPESRWPREFTLNVNINIKLPSLELDTKSLAKSRDQILANNETLKATAEAAEEQTSP